MLQTKLHYFLTRPRTTTLQSNNAAQSVDMLHWAYTKRNWKWSVATLKCERTL